MVYPSVIWNFIALVIFSIGCNSKQSNKDNSLKTLITDTIKLATKNKADSSNSKAKILFDKEKPFEIIYSARGITKQSSATDTNMCKGWTIAQKDLANIIRNCRAIDGHEWHYLFSVLPCIISGELKQNGQVFDFTINAGSWMSISSPDTTVLLGNSKKRNEKYFIEKAWDGK